MKQVIRFFLLLLLPCLNAQAQSCLFPQNYTDLYTSGLRVRCGGAADYGCHSSSFKPNFEPNSGPIPGVSPPSIFYAALWYGGITAGQQINMKGARYHLSNTVYWPGPIPTGDTISSIDCAQWDHQFVVSINDIEAFLVDFSDGIVNGEHPVVQSWPGKNNPYFENYWGFNLPVNADLAPFHDENQDGNYNYLHGDYPVVQMEGRAEFIPSLMTWSVMNDNSGPDYVTGSPGLPAEIQLTSFLTECPDNPLLNNTLFSQYKLINRAPTPIDSFSMGLYVDFDLGFYADDYVGCSPQTNTFYAYNGDNMDAFPPSIAEPSFGENPPVQAVTFLNKSLDRFIHMYSINFASSYPMATKDPSGKSEYFNYLNAQWRDNTPLTVGGFGYNPGSTSTTNMAFPDNPADSNGWSMYNAQLPKTEVRGVGTTYIGALEPGQIVELHTAWTYHRAPGANHLQNVNVMEAEVPHILDLYNNDFDEICQPVVVHTQPDLSTGEWVFAPNPARQSINIDWPEPANGLLYISNIGGQNMYYDRITDQKSIRIQVQNWPSGVYFARFQSGDAVYLQKIVVEK
jgi:hypothetical protein